MRMWWRIIVGVSKAASKVNPSDPMAMANLQDLLDLFGQMMGG